MTDHATPAPRPRDTVTARLQSTLERSALRGDEALVVGLLRAVAVFRVGALVWAGIGAALSTDHVEEPALLLVLFGIMVIVTLLLTPLPGRGSVLPPDRWVVVAAELAIGVLVLLGDGLVYEDSRPQSLPWSWPAAGVMTAGIMFGARIGFLAAFATSAASLFSEVVLLNRDSGIVGAFSKFGLWIMAGTLAGYVAQRLRRAEREISVARAREEFARELHDGVLQTLAVIQRRSSDGELAALARDQEHDLRSFIAGGNDPAHLGFEPALRTLAARHERLYPSCKVSVVVALDFPTLSGDSIEALAGAVAEALVNASKHGEATKITVYAEPADPDFGDVPPEATGADVFVSVKDNGSGFDVEQAQERIGLRSSIRGRIEDAGGHTRITSSHGAGTEVALWL